MARYTDIDLLIDKVEGTTWYHINKNGELVTGANSETDIPLYKHSDIQRVLEEAPEADVVPKSEVGNLKVLLEMTEKAHESLRELYRTDTDALVEAMRKTEVEVAREIFEEIESMIYKYGVINIHKVAELKKKYIPKDCRKCKHMLSCEPNVFGTCDEYEDGEQKGRIKR